MRRAHYLKDNNSSEYPRHCVWIDTETEPEQVTPDLVKHHLKFGWACYRRRSRGHNWSKPQWHRFTTIEDFWEWLTTHIGPKEAYTIFAHNGAFDLPVLNAFNWMQDDGWELKNAVIDSPPIILKWVKDGRSIKFIDTLNIWRMSLAQIGESIGLEKLDMPDGWEDEALGDEYCRRDVEIIMQACIEWFEFIREHDLGGFAPTLASQAMRAYRHRFMQHKLLIDDNEEALTIARAAYHGGRTECFRIGEFDGPLYQLDVNSQYPHVMQSELMPTKLVGLYRRLKHLELLKILKSHAVIAEVTLDIDVPVFPLYENGKLIFPVGTFDTVLTTPEVIYAMEQGYVTQIGLVALYEQAHIFKDYVDYFYPLRQKYKAEGNNSRSDMTKILLNSLYGKFGQRGRVYEVVEQVKDNEIKTWVEVDADTREVYQFRKFAGMVQQLTEEPESRDSHPAIAAHVTAYARMMMWGIYRQAGLENCYYTDTDCVVVNKIGYEALNNRIDEHTLGMLKLEKTIDHASIRGPKDYVFDNMARCKGVRNSALWINPNTVEQESWAGLRGLLARGDMTAPTTKRLVKHLKREYTKGQVDADGVVSPFRYG